MKRVSMLLVLATSGMLLGGCATLPQGPTVAVMPGPGKPFDRFRYDDMVCRQYARAQVGGNPNEIAQQQVISGAVVGGALGALGGILLGGGEDGGDMARSMAGAGVVMGSAVGASAAQQSLATLQGRYNVAYMQCMYAKGNAVPGYPPPHYTPPPPPSYPPPPPPPGAQ